jgi:hypothetical protein
MSKKIKKSIKLRKSEKKNNWKTEPWKNWLNRLEFLKNRPVRFRFDKPETEKPNRTQTEKKPSQTGKTDPNQFEPVFVLK